MHAAQKRSLQVQQKKSSAFWCLSELQGNRERLDSIVELEERGVSCSLPRPRKDIHRTYNMSLAEVLSGLGLSNYAVVLASHGYTERDQLELPESELDAVLASASMLKGHALKLKRALEQTRNRTEPPPSKRPRLEESLTQPAPKKPVSPLNTLTKDVERLMTRLAEIEHTREDICKAREMILAIDLARYRKALDQVEFIQKTIRAVEEAADISSL